jgi:putative exosortase-associated protein (TIGR04073 family)
MKKTLMVLTWGPSGDKLLLRRLRFNPANTYFQRKGKTMRHRVPRAAVAAVILLGVCASSYATEPYMLPIRKLARGLCNIVAGPLEVPMKIWDTNTEEGGLAAATYGTLKGVAFTVAREAVGVTDTVTFLTPLPGCPEDSRDSGWGYGPIMRPEWVVTPTNNYYNIFYNNTPIMQN